MNFQHARMYDVNRRYLASFNELSIATIDEKVHGTIIEKKGGGRGRVGGGWIGIEGIEGR